MEIGNESKFDQWALVEIFGHLEFAGHVSEEQAFGVTLVRVDVPETSRCPAFTKLYGASAIYCITPLGEDEARAYAESLHKEPINTWRIPRAEIEVEVRHWDSHSSYEDDDGFETHSPDDDDEPDTDDSYADGRDFDDDDDEQARLFVHDSDLDAEAALSASRIDSELAQSDLGVETLLDDDLRL